MAIRPIIDALREINNGEFLDGLSNDFHGLIESIKEHEKGGELTIKLSIKPLPQNNEIVTISPQVTVKAPKQLSNTMFFVTDDGNVQRRDPRQKEMKLDVVDVDKETGEIIETEDNKETVEVS